MKKLLEDYEKNYPFYQEVTTKFQAWLPTLFQQQNLHIHSITGRTKEIRSLQGKIDRAQGKYHNLSEITDLCGIRIITYYEDEVDQVALYIRKTFQIDETNSVDKRKLFQANAFGYMSLHLIAELPLNNANLTNAAPSKYCKVEIQICSILQHAWAEIEHDLEYKNQTRETYATRRHFSRLAGLLEFADLEFKKLRDLTVGEQVTDHSIPRFCEPPAPRLPQKSSWRSMYFYGLAISCAAFFVFLAVECNTPTHLAAAVSTAIRMMHV